MEAEFCFLKSKIHVDYTQEFISYLSENKIVLHYGKNGLIIFI
jgi:hypothetical protein